MTTSFDLSIVPRDPHMAITFLLSNIRTRVDEFFKLNSLRKENEYEYIDIMNIVFFAMEKEEYSSNIISMVSTHLKNLNADNDFIFDEFCEIENIVFAIIKIQEIDSRNKLIKAHFNKISTDATFSLDKNEIKHITMLAADMKSIIIDADCFSQDHKRRLIDRVSQVEIEIHRKNGRFDVILAGVVDFGDALGQFGNKVKPLVDRMKEIRGIAQKKSSEYERLPVPDEIRKLPAPSDESENTD